MSMGRGPPTPAVADVVAAASILPTLHPQAPKANVSATLSQPFSGSLNGEDRSKQSTQAQGPFAASGMSAQSPAKNAGSGDDDSAAPTAHVKQSRNRRKKNAQAKERLQAQSTGGNEPVAPAMSRTGSNAGSGWRQTPLLEEPLKQVEAAKAKEDVASTPGQPAKKTRRQQQKLKFEQQNGFATDDATDVQDLGDFDFAGNLSKFDKKAVFDQLRTEDTTADEDRLVSHNRLHKPGTFGGQKLLPTENVLEQSVRRVSREVPEDSDVAVADLAGSLSSLRMERDASRTSMRQPHRKDSSVARGSSRLTGRSASRVTANTIDRLGSPINGPASPAASVAATKLPCLRYSSSKTVCLAVGPRAMHSAEEMAFKQLDGPELGHGGREFNLNADILNENAGRNIAEAAIAAISPGGRRTAPGNHNSEPVVVALAGENTSGARAIAAGRHLLDRGYRVIVTYLEPEEPGADSEQVNDQLLRFNGKVMQWHQLSAYLKKLDAPPELIIDGLLGLRDTLDTIAERRETAVSMMSWANKSKAAALAVDVPSGVNAEDGTVVVVEGEPAEVRAKIVVACAAPCTGLLRAMELRHREGRGDDWKLMVCDVGLTPVLRAFLKKRNQDAVGFGNAWMVQLYFDPGAESGAGRSG